MRVGPVLTDDDVRPERGGQVGEQRPHGVQPGALPGHRLQRDVDGGPGRDPLPHLVHCTRAGEQVPPGFMDGHRQHARVVPVDRLDAVAVMDVEIDVQDAQAVGTRPRDREGDVVIDAEPRCRRAHRMVQPAARVERVVDVPAQDGLHRPDGPARDHRTRIVHPQEWRIVGPVADPGRGPPNGATENRRTISM